MQDGRGERRNADETVHAIYTEKSAAAQPHRHAADVHVQRRDGRHADGISTFTPLYLARAVGGVGLIIMEATAVIPCGRISDHCLGLWNNRQAEALAPIVAACRKQGAAMAIQLNHAGRKCEAGELVVYAPSAIPFDEKSPMPREMTRADIQDTVQGVPRGRGARGGCGL